jgi:hypothetical protein
VTKLCPPLTVHAALKRISRQVPCGYAGMAKLTARSEGMVRAWGDDARREKVPVEDAITLDLAFQASGGKGAPLHEFYTLQLELAAANRSDDQKALTQTLACVIKEVSDAQIAILHASRADATPNDMRDAQREIEEAISSLRNPLAIITRLYRGTIRRGARSTMSP